MEEIYNLRFWFIYTSVAPWLSLGRMFYQVITSSFGENQLILYLVRISIIFFSFSVSSYSSYVVFTAAWFDS